MANELVNKIYVLVEEARKKKYDNAILFAEAIAKKKYEEFSYVRDNRTQYCDIHTVREYISFAKDISALHEDLKAPSNLNYRSQIGFKTWLGDILLQYLKDNKISLEQLNSSSLSLIQSKKKFPTTDILYEDLEPSISEKHFRWALTLLQSVKPLTIDVCRKWIWIPKNAYKF